MGENMAGRSGYPKNSGRVFRVFWNSGFQKYYPKFALKNQYPTFRVPESSGSGSPEIPDKKPAEDKLGKNSKETQ